MVAYRTAVPSALAAVKLGALLYAGPRMRSAKRVAHFRVIRQAAVDLTHAHPALHAVEVAVLRASRAAASVDRLYAVRPVFQWPALGGVAVLRAPCVAPSLERLRLYAVRPLSQWQELCLSLESVASHFRIT